MRSSHLRKPSLRIRKAQRAYNSLASTVTPNKKPHSRAHSFTTMRSSSHRLAQRRWYSLQSRRLSNPPPSRIKARKVRKCKTSHTHTYIQYARACPTHPTTPIHLFTEKIAIGRKDGWISLYGAGNGRLSIAWDNPQQAALAEPRLC